MTFEVHDPSHSLGDWARGVFLGALMSVRKEKAPASGLHKKLFALLSKEEHKREPTVDEPMVPAPDRRAFLAAKRVNELSPEEHKERTIRNTLHEARSAFARSERFVRGQAKLLRGNARKEFLRDVESVVRDAWLHAPEKIRAQDFAEHRIPGVQGDAARGRAHFFLTRLALKVSNEELRNELYLREAARVFYEHARTDAVRYARDSESARLRKERSSMPIGEIDAHAKFAAVMNGVVAERGHEWRDRAADWGTHERVLAERLQNIYHCLPISAQTAFGVRTTASDSAPAGAFSFNTSFFDPAGIGALVNELAKKQRISPSLAVHLGSSDVWGEVRENVVRETERGRAYRGIRTYAEARSSFMRRIVGVGIGKQIARGASLIARGLSPRPEAMFSLEKFAASLPAYQLAVAKTPHGRSDDGHAPASSDAKKIRRTPHNTRVPKSPYSERVPEGFMGVRAFEHLAEKELLVHFGEEFATLSDIGKNFLVGFLREQATAHPPDFGITSVLALAPGDVVDFMVMKKNADFVKRLGEHFELSREAGRLTQSEVDILTKMGFSPDEYVNPDYLNIIRNVSVQDFLRRFPISPGARTPEALGPRIFGPAGSQVVWESVSHHARFADFVRSTFERHPDAGSMTLKDFLAAYGS